jgi:hypothetical protein
MSKEDGSRTSYTVEQTMEDLKKGLEIGIDDLTKKLNVDIKDLSKSELERALSSVINYPDSTEVFHQKEINFINNLSALHGLHLQAEIRALADLQQESEESTQEQGE